MAATRENGRALGAGLDATLSWIFLPVLLLASGKNLPWIAIPLLAIISWLTHTLLILVHELAHFVVGRLCGFSFSEVVVGRGWRIFRVVLGSTEFRLHALPQRGHVLPLSSVGRYSLAKMIPFVSAGIIAEALIGIALAVMSPREWILSNILAERLAYFGLVFAVLFVAVDVAANLVPRDCTVNGQTSPNDGKTLQQLWRTRHALPAARLKYLQFEQLISVLQEGDPAPTRWTRLSTRDILRDRWARLRADRVEIAPGKILDPFYVLEEHEWVHVVAFNRDDHALLVRQYRYPGDTFTWELPGGRANPGEDLLVACQRALREETGATSPRWRHIASPFPNPARQTNRVHADVAEDAAITAAPRLDASESIESAWHSIPATLDLIRRGEFSHANPIALFYLTLDTLGLLTHLPPNRSRAS